LAKESRPSESEIEINVGLAKESRPSEREIESALD
jgi:hypothetical protein